MQIGLDQNRNFTLKFNSIIITFTTKILLLFYRSPNTAKCQRHIKATVEEEAINEQMQLLVLSLFISRSYKMKTVIENMSKQTIQNPSVFS